NRYKIGITTNYKDRLRSLNTIVPFGITIIEIYPSSKYKEIEKEVHERFNNRRRNGEWFEFNENDLKEFIDYVKSMTYVDVRCIREGGRIIGGSSTNIPYISYYYVYASMIT